MNMENHQLYFFIGTEAELIKLFPVIIKCQDKGKICNIIASGQNDLKRSRILDFVKLNGKFVELSKEESIKKSVTGLLVWFIRTRKKARRIISSNFIAEKLVSRPMIVHGDTISTLMGAMVGKALRMKVCHVEAGLRSHNLFSPFPEEIDRLLISRLADMHFAPGIEPYKNLRGVKGRVVNTEFNTILDSLAFSKEIPVLTNGLEELSDTDYFVFVMHRQENLVNKGFMRQVIKHVNKIAQKRKCVLILHKITENALNQMKILEELKNSSRFVLLPRVDYFDFMKLLENAEFVITDGGSNQEELYYMGKPCLIMRKQTERLEGIGSNVLLYRGRIEMIERFAGEYANYVSESLVGIYSPSEIICGNIE
ncbi:MAG: UDP-N-acetylglucosamine 2-epimerase [Roseburia sp.]|nr:UDP-N-acetylglucosamine 2-epimerase [Roseburia sp.]